MTNAELRAAALEIAEFGSVYVQTERDARQIARTHGNASVRRLSDCWQVAARPLTIETEASVARRRPPR